jgi:hypothetical protein
MAFWDRFDALRKENPNVGLAAYAIEPGAAVTLEVFAFGQVGTFEAPTLAGCIEKAFPKPSNELKPLPTPTPPTRTEEIDLTIPDFLRRQDSKAKPEPTPTAISVFD